MSVHTQYETDQTRHPAYTAGYRAATARLAEDLATTLQILGVSTGEFGEDLLSHQMARNIFMGVFANVVDDYLGPDTTGQFDAGKAAAHRKRT